MFEALMGKKKAEEPTPNPQDTVVRCYISGYGKTNVKPCALEAIIDFETGVIVIEDEVNYDKRTNKADYAIITNDRYMDNRAFLFHEGYLQEAVDAYFEYNAMLLSLGTNLNRYNPENVLQILGMDESGKKYGFSAESFLNGTIAILAICYYAKKQRGIHNTLSFFEDEKDDENVDNDSGFFSI